MYLNRERKCAICKKARPTCGDPKIYCRECANALLKGGQSDSDSINTYCGRTEPFITASDREHS